MYIHSLDIDNNGDHCVYKHCLVCSPNRDLERLVGALTDKLIQLDTLLRLNSHFDFPLTKQITTTQNIKLKKWHTYSLSERF